MPLRPCIRCGHLSHGSYCPAHQPVKRPSPSSRATDRPGWKQLRAAALARDERCVRCGRTDRLAAHHVVPVAEGGVNTLDNLTILCERCHRAAHRETESRTLRNCGGS